MLYPVNVFVWTRLAGVLGFATPTRQDFHARGAHELLRGRRLAQHRFLLDQSSAALGPRRALRYGRARLLKGLSPACDQFRRANGWGVLELVSRCPCCAS